MPSKYVFQQRGANGLENKAEIPALENGKIDMSWLSVVGESGAAIIARGSNANGEWVRWEDGTQLAYANAPISGKFDTIISAPWYITNTSTITYPASFIQAPIVVGSVITPEAYSLVSRIVPNTTGFYVLLIAMATVAFSSNARCGYIAIGRWK